MKNIIVCIKQVPDTAEVKINPETNNLMRDGVPSIMNPADRTALECALSIKAEQNACVTVISMGPPQAKTELESALQMGADRAILLCDRKFGGADTLATSYALAQAIAKLPHDLILCGVEAIDGCTGQVGAMIGETLSIPAFTYVDSISIDDNSAVIVRDTGNLAETYEAELPVVACVLKKTPHLKAISANDTEVEVWDASLADETKIGAKGSPTRVVSIQTASRKSSYLYVHYDWSLEQRMEHIFNAGIEQKGNKPLRGSADELARYLISELYQRR